jgi:carboxylesterase
VGLFNRRVPPPGADVLRGSDDAFFLPGPDLNDACLLIHGSTGTAGDMRFLGEFLNGRGFAVQGVSLPGHHRRPTALAGIRWQACYAAVRDAWLDLSTRYRRVHVIGFSFGGSLALHLAANEQVEDLILLAPALFIHATRRSIFLSALGLVPRTKSRILLRWNLGLMRFLRQVRREIRLVRCPLLVIHARDDTLVRIKSSHTIHDRAIVLDRRIHILERGGHLLPHGSARGMVWAEIDRHLAEHRSGESGESAKLRSSGAAEGDLA